MIRAALLGALLALVCAALPFWSATSELPDVEMRTRPNHARPSSWLSADEPVIQRFVSLSDGLRRIDVALSGAAGMPAEGTLELTLSDESGELRTSRVTLSGGLTGPFEFVPFEFEPVADSGGRSFAFSLRPVTDAGGLVPVQVWMRSRRMPGYRDERGPAEFRAEDGAVIEGRFETRWSQLSAVAIAMRTLEPGNVRFELLGATGAEVLRSVDRVEPRARRGGSLFFPFEDIEPSRFRTYRWRLTAPAGSVFAGNDDMASAAHFHGVPRAGGEVLGASGCGWPAGESDVLVRTYSDTAPLGRLTERSGEVGRTVPVYLSLPLWLLAGAGIGLALAAACRRTDAV